MLLVLDTNIVFALSKSLKVIDLVEKLKEHGYTLLIPEFVIEELVNIKEDAKKYTGFSEEEFNAFVKSLEKIVRVVYKQEYEKFLEEANKISPHKKDIPLFALSLVFDKAPIWSREPKLKRQKIVKVLDDKGVEELLERF